MGKWEDIFDEEHEYIEIDGRRIPFPDVLYALSSPCRYVPVPVPDLKTTKDHWGERFVMFDTVKIAVADDAQGFGFTTPYKACTGWARKLEWRGAKDVANQIDWSVTDKWEEEHYRPIF